MSKLFVYGKESYENSRDHGFWDDKENRNKGEMVKLMICESSEAVEAHRKNRKAVVFKGTEPLPELISTFFVTNIKDSIEDEMADVVIRVLDYTVGWGITVIPSEYRKDSTGNFAHDMLRLDYYIIQAFHNEIEPAKFPQFSWGYVLAYIEKLCEWYSIDIENHIKWKQTYNRTRPYKHEKLY